MFPACSFSNELSNVVIHNLRGRMLSGCLAICRIQPRLQLWSWAASWMVESCQEGPLEAKTSQGLTNSHFPILEANNQFGVFLATQEVRHVLFFLMMGGGFLDPS